MVCFLGINLPLIYQFYIDYDCPAKSDDGYEYKPFTENIFANVKYLEDEIVETDTECRDNCDAWKRADTCDFFMFHYRTRRCTMLNFVRPSRVLQIGLTKDAIFCIRTGNNLYK